MVKSQFQRYVPDYVTVVSPKPYTALKAQAQADVWVLNYVYRVNSGIYKGSDQFYIQTWHGDRGLKMIGYADKLTKPKSHNGYVMSDCNLFLAASDYGVMKAHKGLRYESEVITVGMPRNDKLTNIQAYKEEIVEIRKRIGIAEDTNILLYAPTYREAGGELQCQIDIEQTVANLEANGRKWTCLIRSHSLTKQLKVSEDKAVCRDVSDYPDMADLLLVTDLLITDYSSCAGDFLLTGKPVVLAHFDRESYQSKDRQLWVNPEKAGYLVAKNQQELNEIMKNIDTYDHKNIDEKVLQFYGTKESRHASETVVERILRVLGKH
jgi:CDP-glycerol glycerophosphotransferase